MSNAQSTQTTTSVNSNEVAMTSSAVEANATIGIERPAAQNEYLYKVVTIEDKNTGDLEEIFKAESLPPAKYAKNIKLAEVTDIDEVIIPKSVTEYTSLFKKAEERSAREILMMCRVVYEASKSLNSALFHDFCKKIGYRDESSTIRKQIVIGKLQPRLIMHAEALPATWTGIYMITQIPAQIFENMMNGKHSFKDMPVSKIRGFIDDIELRRNINKYVPPKVYTKEEKERNAVQTFSLATVFFTKFPDDLDWAAVKKALLEVEANLPIKVHFSENMSKTFDLRKVARYKKIKEEQKTLIYNPEKWDMGRVVDKVSKTAGGEIVLNDPTHSAA